MRLQKTAHFLLLTLSSVHPCQLLRADMSARSAVRVVFACLCQARSKRQLNEFQVVIVHSSALDADHRDDRDELS